MFGRKTKEIKRLRGDLEAALIGQRAVERMRDTARDESAKRAKEILDLRAERDAFAKRVSELEDKIQWMKPRSGESPNPNPDEIPA